MIMLKYMLLIALIVFVWSCQEDVDSFNFDQYSAVITPETDSVEIFKAGNYTEVTEELLPTLYFNNSITQQTILRSYHTSINTVSYPNTLTSVARTNFLWNFQFSIIPNDSVKVQLPYPKDLGEYILQDLKHLFKLYSCDQNFTEWRLETSSKNDTAANKFEFNYLDQNRNYGIFFEDFRYEIKQDVNLSTDWRTSDEYFYSFNSSQTDYFNTQPDDLLDGKYQGCYLLGNRVFYNVLNDGGNSRVFLDFQYKGIGTYQKNEFNFIYDRILEDNGQWGYSHIPKQGCQLKVLQWGEIGDSVKLEVLGDVNMFIINRSLPRYSTINMKISTIRCR